MARQKKLAIEQVLRPLSAQIVGSYSKPGWLIRKDKAFRFGAEPWRPDAEVLNEARADAARLAIYEQERADLDIVTDGEAQRAAYDRYFYARIGGVDVAHLADRPSKPKPASGNGSLEEDRAAELDWIQSNLPRITAPLTWKEPLSLNELQFLKRHTAKPAKVTIVGPVTAYDKMSDEYYNNPESGIAALARVVNQELRALDREGADIIQIDEPRFHTHAEFALQYGLEALEIATEGLRAPIVVHVCYGYAYYAGKKSTSDAYADVLSYLASSDRVAAISLEYEQPNHQPDLLRACGDKHVVLGLLNLGTHEVETPDHIASRLKDALEVVPMQRLHACSDCGMWHLPRTIAFAKIKALAEGARMVRQELRG